LSLAIVACLGIAFVSEAALFLCAPAVAAMFEREKVIKALILAVTFASPVYYAVQSGNLIVESVASTTQSDWGRKAGIRLLRIYSDSPSLFQFPIRQRMPLAGQKNTQHQIHVITRPAKLRTNLAHLPASATPINAPTLRSILSDATRSGSKLINKSMQASSQMLSLKPIVPH